MVSYPGQVNGNETVSGNLSVGSAATIATDLSVGNDLTVDMGALTLTNGAAINFGNPSTTGSDLYLSDTNELTTDQNLVVGQALTASGNLSTAGSLQVDGSATINTDLTVTGLTNNGDSNISGNLSVTGVGKDQYVVKASGTSRASNTTPSNDPDLTLPVVANGVYLVLASISYTTTVGNGGGGLQYGWSYPTGATMQWSDGDGTGNPISAVSTFQNDDGSIAHGLLKTSSTAGSLTVRWAQEQSSSTATIMLAGCSLYLRRLA